MKYLFSAITLVIATPAAAQTAPAPQHQSHGQHQGHDQHQSHDQHQGHGQHQQHGQHQGHAQHQGQHGQHQQQGGQQGHAPRSDCCADRNGNGRMDCCERAAQAGDRRGCCAEPAPAAPAVQPQGHDGH